MAQNTIDIIDIYVGKRLRLGRKTLKITQSELARKVSITFQQIQKYEKGSNRISASRLYQFAQILNRNPAWFFEGLESNKSNIDGSLFQHKTLQLVEYYYKSPQEVRKLLRELIKALGNKGRGA